MFCGQLIMDSVNGLVKWNSNGPSVEDKVKIKNMAMLDLKFQLYYISTLIEYPQ